MILGVGKFNRESSPTPSHGLAQTPTIGNHVPKPTLFDKLDSSKNAVLAILQGFAWPGKSVKPAQEFFGIINSIPDLRGLPEHVTTSPSKLRDAVEQLIKHLEDVQQDLASATSKYGKEKKEFVRIVKEATSWDQVRCSQILRSCREDIEKVLVPLHVGLAQYHSQRTSAEQIDTPQDPAINPLSLGNSGPSPSHNDGGDTIRKRAVSVARKIFKTVDAISSTIPIVGNYVGAAARVGLAVVQMIEKMDDNDDMTKDLVIRASKLSKIIEYFETHSREHRGGEITAQIDDLKKEIERVQTQIQEWEDLDRWTKVFSATDHRETLNSYKKTFDYASHEMQVLASLNIMDLVEQLRNDNLLNRLGNGEYGAGTNSIENATCLPGTRVEILKHIDDWIENSEAQSHVLWIRGMAGRGKSTIARTVAQNWRGRAASAIFHVRRDQDAVNKLIICALARQLAYAPMPEVSNAILASVQKNPNIEPYVIV